MNWNKQLYEFEVNPPENAWDNIVHDLDNDHLIFKNKLKHAETTPPSQVWNNIVQDLENDHLLFKDRLKHAAITPPPNLWNNIVHDIENDHLVFKTQLRDAAILPPDTAWQNISERLNPQEEQKGRLINIATILKVAVAAAVIGILFFTTNYYFSNNAVEHETAVAQPKDSPASQQSVTPYTKGETSATESGKKYIASAADISRKRKADRLRDNAVETYTEHSYRIPSPAAVAPAPASVTDRYDVDEGFSKYVRNLKGEIREDVTLMDLPNSYFYMTGPDGQSIRVSSKFRNTIQYLNGSNTEELLDVILKESRYWKNRFKAWKEEVNNATLVPAPYNFMDIPELMRLLEQNSGN